jgi:hypothetical protein
MPGVNTVSYKLQGDTFERFVQQDDGTQIWGSGAAAGDVIMKRTGAAQVTLTGVLVSGAQTAVPTIPSPFAGYGTISFSAASTDQAGAITFTVTGTPAASAVALPVVFNRTYTAAPKAVTLTLGTSQTTNPITLYYVTGLATTGFTIGTNAAGAAQAGVVIDYIVAF